MILATLQQIVYSLQEKLQGGGGGGEELHWMSQTTTTEQVSFLNGSV